MSLPERTPCPPTLKRRPIPPDCAGHVRRLITPHWSDAMSLRLDVPPEEVKANESVASRQPRRAVPPPQFELHRVVLRDKELVARHEAFRGQYGRPVGL